MHARPLILILLLLGGAGYGLWWYFNRPETYVAPEGYSVDYPQGWESRVVEGSLKMYGVITGGGGGSGTGHASWHPHSAGITWPADARQYHPGKPIFEEETKIDDRPALVAFVEHEGNKTVVGVVDRGDGFIVVHLTCPLVAFNDNRGTYERCVRGIRCKR